MASGCGSEPGQTSQNTSAEAPKSHTPLNHLSQDQAAFSVYDSPLSEFSILGFEYGYALIQPRTLTLWEAQFGDFCNGAQVIIDNYVASGETKWFRSNGLVMLLPHGYEGQGPEHSSAHLERFMQLCAEENIQVCNPTTPAQYFHLLRRQMLRPFRKPLVVMTPKSLLRHSRAVSRMDEMAGGGFHEVLGDPSPPADPDVRVALLCSGKIFYDLFQRREKTGRSDQAIIRLEQLYPFPHEAVGAAVGRFDRLEEVIWVQEEPENRGAWRTVRPWLEAAVEGKGLKKGLRYVGRKASASPATGSHSEHAAELESILTEAVGEAEDETA